jgi:hypothetical protein
VPTCCTELADRSGDVTRARADRTVSSRLREPHVRSTAIVSPGQTALASTQNAVASPHGSVASCFPPALSDVRNTFGNPPTASDIISLTALSCRRTFTDSAIKKASVRRQRFVPD